MKWKCDYCKKVATIVAYYGDEYTCFGGGQVKIYLCNNCVAPCNHYADPHASFTHEEEITITPIMVNAGCAEPAYDNKPC